MSTQTGSLWNKPFILMMTINSITFMGFILVNPILSKYMISMGASISFAGVVTGAFALTALLFRPFTGQVSDRFNKKRLMMFTLLTIAFITLGYGLIKDPLTILILRIIHGVFFSFFSTVSNSFGATFIPSDKLGQGVGLLGIGRITAGAFGPSISPYIAAEYGYSVVFYVSFFIMVTALLMMLFLKNTEPIHIKSNTPRFSIKLNNLIAKELVIPMILGGIASLMNGLIASFILLFGDARNIENISLFFLLNAVFLLISRLVSGKVLDKKGLSYIIYPAFILIIASVILFGLSHSLWIILIAAALYGFGQGASQPSLQAYCIKKMGPAKMGIAVSTYFLGVDFAQGLGPMLGGVIIEKFGYTVLFFLVAALLAGAIFLYRYYSKRNKDQVTI